MKSLKFPTFELEKIKEYLDNPPLVFFVSGALLWGLVQILLDANIGNYFGIWVSLVYLALIFGSLIALETYLEDVSIDWKENFDWLKFIAYSLFGLFLIFVINIIVISLSETMMSVWKVWSLSQLQEIKPEYGPIVVNFFGIARFIGIDAKKLQDVLTNFFLIGPGEELVFRGVMTYSISKPLKTPWVGGIISTGVWAFIHSIAAYTVPGLVLLYVLIAYLGGIVMFVMMILTQDITTAILIHSVYNSVVVMMG